MQSLIYIHSLAFVLYVTSFSAPIAVSIALYMGLALSIISTFYIALAYIPSAVSTILRYRYGVIPTFHDREFLQCRYAIDSSTTLFGAATFGSIWTGLLFFVASSLLVFFVLLFVSVFGQRDISAVISFLNLTSNFLITLFLYP